MQYSARRHNNKDTGKLLWEQERYADPEGLAAVYQAGGREYLFFCAAGRSPESAPTKGFAWKAGKATAKGYYALALPKVGGE